MKVLTTKLFEMSNEELVDYFIKKLDRGEMTFDQIRPELVRQGLDENDVRSIVREVDHHLLQNLSSRESSLNQFTLIGMVFTVLGVIVTLGSLAGFFSLRDGHLVIVAYGPILTGIAMIFVGLRRRKRSVRGFRTGRMRRDDED